MLIYLQPPALWEHTERKEHRKCIVNVSQRIHKTGIPVTRGIGMLTLWKLVNQMASKQLTFLWQCDLEYTLACSRKVCAPCAPGPCAVHVSLSSWTLWSPWICPVVAHVRETGCPLHSKKSWGLCCLCSPSWCSWVREDKFPSGCRAVCMRKSQTIISYRHTWWEI